MKSYQSILYDIVHTGHRKGDRTGTGTRSLFAQTIRHNMQDGFPILTTKKVFWEKGIEEMQWVLRGERNVIPLLEKGIRWWTDWPLRRYMETNRPSVWQKHLDENGRVRTDTDEYEEMKFWFESFLVSGGISSTWGDLGPVYGYNLRHFEAHRDDSNPQVGYGWRTKTDQLEQVYQTLQTNPDDRRMLMTMWHPALVDEASLPPCHGISIALWTRKLDNNRELCMFMEQRSADYFLGVPVNIVMYAYFLEVLAHSVNMVPGELALTFIDCHLYENHLDQAREQIIRKPYALPRFEILCEPKHPADYTMDDIRVVGYNHHDRIAAPIAV